MNYKILSLNPNHRILNKKELEQICRPIVREIFDDYARSTIAFSSRKERNTFNHIMFPEKFYKLFKKYFPNKDYLTIQLYRYLIERLGQEDFKDIFLKAYFMDKQKKTVFDKEKLTQKLQQVEVNKQYSINKYNVHIMEYLNEEIGFFTNQEMEVLLNSLKKIYLMVSSNFNINYASFLDFLSFIKQLHSDTYFKTETPGDNMFSLFRKTYVESSGRPRIFSHPNLIFNDLNELYYIIQSTMFQQSHPIIQAAIVYLELVDIHPFNDHNERTAQLVMDYFLLKGGFPPLIITPENKEAFIRLLRFAEDPLEVADFVAEQIVVHQKVKKSIQQYARKIASPNVTKRNNLMVCDSVKECNLAVLDEVKATIAKNESPVILTAIGETFQLFYYKYLLEAASLPHEHNNFVNLSNVTFFLTEECEGEKYNQKLFMNFISLLPGNNRPRKVVFFHTDLNNRDETINVYKFYLENTKIDLALLGMGPKGHLAYNEVHSPLDSECRLVSLHPSTIKHHNLDCEFAYTVGMKDIMNAKRLIIFVNDNSLYDSSKRTALQYSLETEYVTGSYARLHEDFLFITDKKTWDKSN